MVKVYTVTRNYKNLKGVHLIFVLVKQLLVGNLLICRTNDGHDQVIYTKSKR